MSGIQTDLVEQTAALIGVMARSIERTSRSAEDAARSSAEASTVELSESASGLTERTDLYSLGAGLGWEIDFDYIEKNAV
mgnify:CR=1 FL=1